MRKVLSLPVKRNSDAAAFARTMGKPIELPAPPAPFIRSRLFDDVMPVEKVRKPGAVHLVERGTLGQYPLIVAKGEMNRPDKSEPKINLTFNWNR